MIRTLKRLIATDNNDNKEYVEIACLSTDSKPTTGIITGSVIYEVDTGKRYEFNEAASTWVEQPAGGGGSVLPPVETTDKDKYLHTNAETGDLEWREASGGYLMVTLTATLNSMFQPSAFTSDKTYTEISNAFAAGTPVLAVAREGASGNRLGVSPVDRVYISGLGYVFESVLPFNNNKYKVTINLDNTISFIPYVDINDPISLNLAYSTPNYYTPAGTGWYVKDYAQLSKANTVFCIDAAAQQYATSKCEYFDIVYFENSRGMMGIVQYEVRIKGRESGTMYSTGTVNSDTAELKFYEYTPTP